LVFPAVRLAAAFLLILAPAVALGATFPIAVDGSRLEARGRQPGRPAFSTR
jgi:hypothetical protein